MCCGQCSAKEGTGPKTVVVGEGNPWPAPDFTYCSEHQLLQNIMELQIEVIRQLKMNALEYRIFFAINRMEDIAATDRFGTGLTVGNKTRYEQYQKMKDQAESQLEQLIEESRHVEESFGYNRSSTSDGERSDRVGVD